MVLTDTVINVLNAVTIIKSTHQNVTWPDTGTLLCLFYLILPGTSPRYYLPTVDLN